MPAVHTRDPVELELQIEDYVLSRWRRTGDWPSIRQTARSLGTGVAVVHRLVRYSTNMEVWVVGTDERNYEIMIQSDEVDNALGSYWSAWQDQQLKANQI